MTDNAVRKFHRFGVCVWGGGRRRGLSWPRGYKTFYMLNSIDHEIFPVGILTFMSGKNSILGISEPKKQLNVLIFLYL